MDTMNNNLWMYLVFAYSLGSIPFGKIIGKFYKIDIQKKGSGNIGFANTYRILGPKPAVVVLFGDTLKGFIPVMLAKQDGFAPVLLFFIGLTAIAGHIFPIWLRFKGGKGMATGLGVLFALSLKLAAIALIVWFTVLTVTKIFSLASLTASLVVLLFTFLFTETRALTQWIFVTVLLGFLFHRDNIKRILKGEEPRSWKW